MTRARMRRTLPGRARATVVQVARRAFEDPRRGPASSSPAGLDPTRGVDDYNKQLLA